MVDQRTWGGRFEGGMEALTADYTAGMDRDFWAHDISMVSIALMKYPVFPK